MTALNTLMNSAARIWDTKIVPIKQQDHDSCNVLAEKNGLNFEAKLKEFDYPLSNEDIDEIVFSCRVPWGLSEDLAKSLHDQTGLYFLNDGNEIHLRVKNLLRNEYHSDATHEKRLEGFNKINQDELKDIIRAGTKEIKNNQNLQLA